MIWSFARRIIVQRSSGQEQSGARAGMVTQPYGISIQAISSIWLQLISFECRSFITHLSQASGASPHSVVNALISNAAFFMIQSRSIIIWRLSAMILYSP
jgi:hypothetical protein